MQLRKIVAAVDETPAGVHALRAAALVAQAAGADLVALRVVADPWSVVRPDEVEPLRAHKGTAPADLAEARLLIELRQLIGDTIGAARAQPEVRFGLAGIELARWATLLGADLLVLGREPAGQFERRPANRTIARTLEQAAMPCLVVPFGQRTWHRVLVVHEAEPGARLVADVAATFAGLWGTMPLTTQRQPARTMAAVAAGGAADEPLPAPVDPVGETLKLAREEQADALVVGYHDGREEGGGMPWRLVQRATCSVLTVPVNHHDAS